MNNKLLILNLGVDAENTSLAFTQKWINELSLNYLKVDVITLKVGKKYKLNENVSLHYVNKNDSGYSKIHQLKILNKITKELIKNNQYSHCFAHMAPLQHLIAKFYLSQNNIKSTLWFTHAGPKFGIKWLILFLSSVLANNIVTASKYSFPFKFKKIQVIGHGINFDNFYNEKLDFSNKNILILSRVSKSKNIENSLDNIVKCKNFEKFKVDIIGGTLNIQDEEYLGVLGKVVEGCKANNVVPGFWGSSSMYGMLAGMGYRFMVCGADVHALVASMETNAQAVKKELNDASIEWSPRGAKTA